MEKSSQKGQQSVKSVIKKMKKVTTKSSRSGKKVNAPKQAIAIGLSKTREKRVKVPSKPRSLWKTEE